MENHEKSLIDLIDRGLSGKFRKKNEGFEWGKPVQMEMFLAM